MNLVSEGSIENFIELEALICGAYLFVQQQAFTEAIHIYSAEILYYISKPITVLRAYHFLFSQTYNVPHLHSGIYT